MILTLTMVPMHLVPLAWPEVAPWIEAACARVPSEYEPDDYRVMCERGEGGLVLIGPRGEAPAAAGIRQIRDHADGTRSCWVLAVGGARAAPWRDVMSVIEADARAKACTTIKFVGRPGWARLLPDFECRRAGRQAEYRKELA